MQIRVSMLLIVTPCVGVWIETLTSESVGLWSKSHPAWVCGLKLIASALLISLLGHTLRGCVD